jgi:hypothetical protein
VECARRLLLASIIGITAADSAGSPVIALCICLFFIGVFLTLMPLANASSNVISVVLAYSLTFFFLAGQSCLPRLSCQKLSCFSSSFASAEFASLLFGLPMVETTKFLLESFLPANGRYFVSPCFLSSHDKS